MRSAAAYAVSGFVDRLSGLRTTAIGAESRPGIGTRDDDAGNNQQRRGECARSLSASIREQQRLQRKAMFRSHSRLGSSFHPMATCGFRNGVLFDREVGIQKIKCATAHLRHLGCKQTVRVAVNDRMGIGPEEVRRRAISRSNPGIDLPIQP